MRRLLLLLAAAGCGEDPVEQAPDRPALARNVLVISIDTLRADRLEAWGYGRETAPNVAALARRGTRFEHAFAQSSQTAPSHASLFTSTWCGVHGVINAHSGSAEVRQLPDGLVTLAEAASAAGLQTAAFVGGGNLSRRLGHHHGFEVWDEAAPGVDVSDRIDDFLAWEATAEGPFLALFHTYECHAPYLPPRELAQAFTDPEYAGPLRARYERFVKLQGDAAWDAAVGQGTGEDYWDGMLEFTEEDVAFLSDLYDAEIAYVDSQLRRLLEVFLAGERVKDTAIVLLSDHGEEFRDHGKFQHDQLFEELLHVPLVIRLPGADKGRKRSEAVDLIDVAPTVAEILGVPWEENGWQGRSLVPLLTGQPEWKPRPSYAELVLESPPRRYASVRFDGWKYIESTQDNVETRWEWLFDLGADPLEKGKLLEQPADAAGTPVAKLKAALGKQGEEEQRLAQAAGEGRLEVIDDEDRAELGSLGYVGK